MEQRECLHQLLPQAPRWSGPLRPLSLSHRRSCDWHPSCDKGHIYPEGPPPPDSHRGVSRLRDAPEERILAQRESLATGTHTAESRDLNSGLLHAQPGP